MRPAPALSDPRFWLLAAAALLLACALLVPGLVRERARMDAVFVIDITGSMNVRDAGAGATPRSRLDAAKAAVVAALARAPCGSRAGLAVFSERRPFLLLAPVEVCGNFAPLADAVEHLHWRMAWEGDSRIAGGLERALEMADRLGSGLVFLTDGHEAPPPREAFPEIAAPEVRGLVVGVGGDAPQPIPRFDEDGREVGVWAAHEVPHENRLGPPPASARQRDGYDPRNAPYGAAASVGEEHLSALREDYLRHLAGSAGLDYLRLDAASDLAAAALRAGAARTVPVAVDLRPLLAGLALVLLCAVYAWPGLLALARRLPARRPARPPRSASVPPPVR